MSIQDVFEFDFETSSRIELIQEAEYQLNLSSGLGPRTDADPSKRLLEQLSRSMAEFGAYPEVIPLKEKHFDDVGLVVPNLFKEWSKNYNFYWLRLPFTLYAAENMPFSKLKCGIEFSPDESEPHLKPTAHTILPDKKFKRLLEFQDSLELGIGENFEFEVAAGIPKLEAGKFKGAADLGLDIKAAGNMGLVVGPFNYSWKKATLDHTPPGTEKVIWRLEGADYFHENDGPTFLVVMKVPKKVKQVQVAAAMETAQKFDWAGATPGEAWRHFSARLKNFFNQGAPIQDTRTWDFTEGL